MGGGVRGWGLLCCRCFGVGHESVDQVDGAVGEGGELLVVGDDDEGLAHLVAQAEEELVQLLLVVRVERARRFVGQDDVGLVHQCACHGHALLLAARELGGTVVGAVSQAEVVEQLKAAGLHFALLAPGDEAGDHDVFEGREFGQQLVKLEYEAEVLAAEAREAWSGEPEHVLTGNVHFAGVGGVECAHDLEQGGFACTAGADNADHFVGLDVEVDAFEHFECAEGLVDVAEGDHGGVAVGGWMGKDVWGEEPKNGTWTLGASRCAVNGVCASLGSGIASGKTGEASSPGACASCSRGVAYLAVAGAAEMPSFFITVAVTSELSVSLITMPAPWAAFLSMMYT